MDFAYKKQIEIQNGEYWFVGAIGQGIRMPISKTSEYVFDGSVNRTGNAIGGTYLSTDGRFVYAGLQSKCEVKDGRLTVYSDREPEYGDGFGDLKNVYLHVADTYFTKDSVKVPEIQLLKPQYCTWTEMDVNVSEEKVIALAESIVSADLPHGVLIIDDGWMTSYGEWTFDKNKFSDPKRMIGRLKELGFAVEMWLVPYVSTKAKDYSTLAENGALVKNKDGSVYMVKWWQGTDALLDMTSPVAKEWLKSQLDNLMNNYGVSGFKFDGGCAYNYAKEDLVFFEKRTPNGHSKAYAEFAMNYAYIEVRDYTELQGQHIVTRLNDKRRNFGKENGLGALVPGMIQAGLSGYPYTCADMIGGGSNTDFAESREQRFDYELASRSCECSALFPCMQFSYAYWNRDAGIKKVFEKYVALHEEISGYLHELIKRAESDFSPIVRALEYEFPHQNLATVMDEFMLGDKYLAAPVVDEGATEKRVVLPRGASWLYVPTQTVYEGGQTVTIDAPIEVLPYFKRINKE